MLFRVARKPRSSLLTKGNLSSSFLISYWYSFIFMLLYVKFMSGVYECVCGPLFLCLHVYYFKHFPRCMYYLAIPIFILKYWLLYDLYSTFLPSTHAYTHFRQFLSTLDFSFNKNQRSYSY